MLPLFRCILYCSRTEHSGLLLAAYGDSIYTFSASAGKCLSIWLHAKGSFLWEETLGEQESTGAAQVDDGPGRPPKRRKLSANGDVSDSTSAEIVTDNDGIKARRAKPKTVSVPSIFKLAATSTGKYVVAVTDEDKCIRVLELLADGRLHQVSERHMPKRPCAVTFTTDESTILCADKFGDVYALPLLISSTQAKMMATEIPATAKNPNYEAKTTRFVPSASALTVHTKRNQQALKNQQNPGNKPTEKKSLDFDHELLLGHVSLLTDLVYVTVSNSILESPDERSYLLSSDRDEHIRVSRGLPQAHITEGFCLEHSEFVSKLCIPPWNTNLLISGGGNDFLLVWNWLESRVRQKVELQTLVAAFQRSHGENQPNSGQRLEFTTETDHLAVSGIWSLRTDDNADGKPQGEIIVTCERMPALVLYSCLGDGTVKHHQTLEVEGHIVDLAIFQEQMSIVYSMDMEDKSTPPTDNKCGSHPTIFGAYSYSRVECCWNKDSRLEEVVKNMNSWVTKQDWELLYPTIEHSILSESIYSIEKLRKRGQDDQ
ncbi:tRNA (guanine-N(7)-)-methyltransferase non-catalytic subunit trm82 [Lambiella insularis]|nr:tRNA (guanine-N(7)-)-methyltransferase non-catalytic subunit trm82 [Lambiella insularis]